MLDSPSEVFPVVLKYLGKDPSSNSIADYTAALDILKKVRPDIRKFGDSTVVNEVADGSLCVFLAWSGDINTAAIRAESPDIKMLFHKDSIMFVDSMAIPTDAKNIEQAYAWINYTLDPKNAATITNELGYAMANKAALDQSLVKKEYAEQKTLFLSQADMDLLEIRRLPSDQAALRAMNDAFRVFKTGK